MKNIVYKYVLEFSSAQILELPRCAQIIHCAFQDEPICLWALVDPSEQQKIERTFYIVGTGQVLPDNEVLKHIATLTRGGFVWHIFEKVC